MRRIDQIEPLSLESPVVFREEHEEPVFDPEDQPEGLRIIDCRTMEIEGETLREVLNVKYGHDPAWTPVWKQKA